MTVADERGYHSHERAASRAARFVFLRGPKISRGAQGGGRAPLSTASGRERREDPGPAPDALVEALYVIFLVWAVDGVIIIGIADEHCVHAEN